MADINVDLSSITPSGDGKYYEAFPAGDALVSFGNAAFGGNYTNDTLTITTDGTNPFGTKTQAAPVLWDFGSDVYEDGVLNSSHADLADDAAIPVTASDVYTDQSNMKITTSRAQRHAGIDRHYYSQSVDCELKNPRAYDISGTNTTMYASWAFRYPVHPHFVRRLGVTTSSGTFIQGSNGDWGEDLNVTIGASTYDGKLYSIDGSTCTLAADFSLNSGTGTVSIEGVTSGATATLTTTTDYMALSSTKLFRIVQTASNGALSVAQISNRQFWVEDNTAGVDSIGMSRSTYSPTYGDFNSFPKWMHMELFFDWTGGTSISAYMRIDGETEQIPAQTAGNILTNQPMKLELFGSDASVQHDGLWFDMGEVYQDTTAKRVTLENVAGDQFELQRITSWSNTEIVCDLNLGALSSISGSKVRVWDDDNTVIAEVTI